MKLTIEQTDTILQILEDYGLAVINFEDFPLWFSKNMETTTKEYFNEKVNEALEVENDNN